MTTAETTSGDFTAPLPTWRQYADEVRSEGVVLLADAVTAALDGLPSGRGVERPIVLTITRHDDAGSWYTVTARYPRGRRATRAGAM